LLTFVCALSFRLRFYPTRMEDDWKRRWEVRWSLSFYFPFRINLYVTNKFFEFSFREIRWEKHLLSQTNKNEVKLHCFFILILSCRMEIYYFFSYNRNCDEAFQRRQRFGLAVQSGIEFLRTHTCTYLKLYIY